MTVRSLPRTFTVAETNAIGAVGLEFLAPTEVRLSSSSHQIRPWVVLTFEKSGYQPHDLPLQPEDFVQLRGLRLLTRGVTLRRAS